jgi:hypothetical protein
VQNVTNLRSFPRALARLAESRRQFVDSLVQIFKERFGKLTVSELDEG